MLIASSSLLHNWKKTIKAAQTPAENELIELKKKLRIVEMENEILKKSGPYLRQRRVVRYGFFEREKERYPVRLICRVMGVSFAGYYAYGCGTSYLKGEKDEALQRWVKKVFWDHKRRYGARRISEELSGQGGQVGSYRV